MTAQPPNQQPQYQQPQYQQPQYQQPPYWMPPPNRDADHLKLLWIFHYVLGGLTAFLACFPCIYVAIGVLFVMGKMQSQGRGSPPPPEVGWVFIILGSVLIIMGWTLATLLLWSAGRLKKMRSWTFCFVVACASCLLMPMGTVLGVFTILVLSRPTVKAMFGVCPAAG